MPVNMNDVVKNLKINTGALAVAVVSRDGLVIAAEMPPGVYTETFAIMCATILGASITALSELKRTTPERVIIESSDTRTIILGAGKKALLICVVDSAKDMNVVLPECQKAVDAIKAP
jgi:predicted regulator of Ras-like GTPase activity (Roadblock/LC7/MglB family)